MSSVSPAGNEITDAVRLAGVQGDGQTYPDSSFGIWPAATNLCTNGGFETNTTGWGTGGTNTIATSTDFAKFGSKSCKFTYQDNNLAAQFTITLTAAAHKLSAWLYIPSSYDGTVVTVRFNGFTGATGTVAVNANMALTNQWQRVSVDATIDAGDLGGTLQVVVTGGAPTAGKFFYIDGVQCELGSVATPYIGTDGGTATRSAGRINVRAAGLINTTQGWVAMRIRSGTATGDATGYRWFSFGDSANERLEGVMGSTTHSLIKQTGGAGTSVSQAVTRAVGDKITGTFAWTSAIAKLSLNGAAFTSQANSSVPNVTTNTFFDIGRQNYGANFWLTGDVLWFACGSGTLTDADTAALHAFGDTDPTPQQLFANLGAAARPTGLWTADTAVYSALLAVPPARITGPWRVWPSRRGRR